MTTGKTIALTRWAFVGKVMSLLLNMLSRLVIAFLPRSKCLLISQLQSLSQWFWSPKNSLSLFPLFPHLYAMKWWDQDAMILVFWMLSFKSTFSISSFSFIERLFISSLLPLYPAWKALDLSPLKALLGKHPLPFTLLQLCFSPSPHILS